jgi:hypothetical protein
LLAAVPTLGAAEMQQSHFQVSAQVLPRAAIEAVSAPAMLDVTDADISRGYKDYAASYRVRSNDPRGYWLRFDTRQGLADSVEVRGLASPLTIGELGAEVLQAPAARQQAHTLLFRLHFAPAAQAGTYPLPVLVAVATL